MESPVRNSGARAEDAPRFSAPKLLRRLKSGLYVSDSDFDRILPVRYRAISRTHWSCVRAAARASRLACYRPGARVLDVGSGVGKFCFVGALTNPGAIFHGVEQRGALVSAAKKIAKQHAIPAVSFFHRNAFELDWARYDAVYLYNPFWENMDSAARIDSAVPLDAALLIRYVAQARDKFSALPVGARVVIMNGFGGDIPRSLRLIHFERVRGLDLTVWEKN